LGEYRKKCCITQYENNNKLQQKTNCKYPIQIFIFACCSLLPEDSDGEEIENTNKCVLVWEVG